MGLGSVAKNDFSLCKFEDAPWLGLRGVGTCPPVVYGGYATDCFIKQKNTTHVLCVDKEQRQVQSVEPV